MGDGCFWRLGFSLNEGFPGYILCHNFVGMLSILLHVDLQLNIYFRSIMGYMETVILFVAKFPYKWYQSYGCVVVTLN